MICFYLAVLCRLVCQNQRFQLTFSVLCITNMNGVQKEIGFCSVLIRAWDVKVETSIHHTQHKGVLLIQIIIIKSSAKRFYICFLLSLAYCAAKRYAKAKNGNLLEKSLFCFVDANAKTSNFTFRIFFVAEKSIILIFVTNKNGK